VVTGYSGILRRALGDGPLAERVDKIAIAAHPWPATTPPGGSRCGSIRS
jgi:hypothetical protein